MTVVLYYPQYVWLYYCKTNKQAAKYRWFNILNNYFSLPQYEEDHLNLVPKHSNTYTPRAPWQ